MSQASVHSGSSPSVDDPLFKVRLLAALRNGDPSSIIPLITDISKNSRGSLESPATDAGSAALHLAIRCAKCDTILLLLQQRAISPNAVDPETGATALHLASAIGRADVVSLLLEQDEIDDTVRDPQGKTCLEVAKTRDVARIIKESRSLLNANYLSLLRLYIMSPKTTSAPEALLKLLKSPRIRSVDLNQFDASSGSTLLHEAVRRKDLQLIELAVRVGADVFVRDKRGRGLMEIAGKDDRTKVYLRQFTNQDTTLLEPANTQTEEPTMRDQGTMYTSSSGKKRSSRSTGSAVFTSFRRSKHERAGSTPSLLQPPPSLPVDEAGTSDDEDSWNELTSRTHPPHQDAVQLVGNTTSTHVDLALQLLDASGGGGHSEETQVTLRASLTQAKTMLSEYSKMVTEREEWFRAQIARERERASIWEDSLQKVVQQGAELEEELKKTIRQNKDQRRRSRLFNEQDNEATIRPKSGRTNSISVAAEVALAPTLSPVGEKSPVPAGLPPSTPAASDAVTSTSPSRVAFSSPRQRVPSKQSIATDSDSDEFFDAIEANALPNMHIPEQLKSHSLLPVQDDWIDSSRFEAYQNLRTRLGLEKDNRPPVSLWSVLKGSIGKDLTRISFPVFFTVPGDPSKSLEHYSWKKVITNVSGFILGSPTIDHYGEMTITNHRTMDQCILTFKPRGWKAKDSFEITGKVFNSRGESQYDIAGRWNSQLVARKTGNYTTDLLPDVTVGQSASEHASPEHEYILLWRNSEKPPAPFNLTPFAITLNDCPPSLKPQLPPTDCRLRPDQRAFELGQYELANELKSQQEEFQRATRRKREAGLVAPHKPRWFEAKTEPDTGERVWAPRMKGNQLEYWWAREQVVKSLEAGNPIEWPDVDHIYIDAKF
ncbi:hypothetical protein FRC19_006384 [Serendipita sp. 401]|nr:hypothetical protein FRC19_006384 [Serendipita sp. 401]